DGILFGKRTSGVPTLGRRFCVAQHMVTLDLALAKDQLAKALAGDPAAIAFLSSLFPTTVECFVCAKPVGEMGTTSIIPDPSVPAMGIILPISLPCAHRPDAQKRLMRVVRSTWPGRRWSIRRDSQGGYLKGSRIKRRTPS